MIQKNSGTEKSFQPHELLELIPAFTAMCLCSIIFDTLRWRNISSISSKTFSEIKNPAKWKINFKSNLLELFKVEVDMFSNVWVIEGYEGDLRPVWICNDYIERQGRLPESKSILLMLFCSCFCKVG